MVTAASRGSPYDHRCDSGHSNWKFQSSLTSFSLLIYPLAVVQNRTTCLRYIKPVGHEKAEWLPSEAFKPRTPLLLEYPTPSGSFASLNVFATTYRALNLIAQREGVLSLYRGIFATLGFYTVRDCALFHLLRVFHKPVGALCSYGIPRLQEETESVLPESGRRRRKRPSCTLAPIQDIPHLALKAASEMVAYPLLVLAARQTVFEGPSVPSVAEMAQLSIRFDGICNGLYPGIWIHLIVRVSEDLADWGCGKYCLNHPLSPTQESALRTAVSTITGALSAPLCGVAMLQRAQSNIPGLCDPHIDIRQIFINMPWKLLVINFGLTALMAMYSIFETLKSGDPRLDASSDLNDES